MKFRDWFDRIERTLAEDAAVAGLMEHSATVGAAREFLVNRALRSILPTAVDIRAGRVISKNTGLSKQLDIVVYDSRFPRMELSGGVGLYPVEGVIATIEVKSTLTKQTLHDALDNCRSVLDLYPFAAAGANWEPRVDQLAQLTKSRPVAHQLAAFEIMPATYVFSFQSALTSRHLSKHVGKWFERHGYPRVANDRCPLLPRIVVGGGTIGVLSDSVHTIDTKDKYEQDPAMAPPTDAPIIFGSWDVNRRFGWLMSHLMRTCAFRLGTSHSSGGFSYSYSQYMPTEEYFREDCAGHEAAYLFY